MDISGLLSDLRARFKVQFYRDGQRKKAIESEGRHHEAPHFRFLANPKSIHSSADTLVSEQDPFWALTFQRLFVRSHRDGRDDLLFFVRWNAKQGIETVEVMRKDAKTLPDSSDGSILWDQTLYLNLILHEFEYLVTCCVVTVKPGSDCINTVKAQVVQRVYPSPTRRSMDKKGKESDVVYPNIMFCVDNFEDVFSDIHLNHPGEKVAVQLFASNKTAKENRMVFLGAVDYLALKTSHELKDQVPLATKLRNQFTLRRNSRIYDLNQTYQFIQMRGPGLKGFAEMAVCKAATIALGDTQQVELVSREYKGSPQVKHTSKTHSDSAQSQSALTENNGATNGDPGYAVVDIPGVAPESVSDSTIPPLKTKAIIITDSGKSRVDGEEGSSSGATAAVSDDSPDGAHSQKKGTIKDKLKLHKLSSKRKSMETEEYSLHAYLTYVQLPWYTLVDDILNNTKKQIL